MTDSKRSRLMVVAAAVVLVFTGLPDAPARAQEQCDFEFATGPDGDEVLVWTCEDDWGGGGGDGAPRCYTDQGGAQVRVPCVHETLGWFTSTYGGCYIKPVDQQPPAGHEDWDGNDPEDGAIYAAACFVLDGVDGKSYAHLPTNMFFPAGEDMTGDLVERVIGRLAMRGPDVGLAPDPSGAGLVGLPVWMWTEDTDRTWGPLSASLTALGHTISAEANASHVDWDMGDGHVETCHDPGTPYRSDFGAEPSPTCGHIYERPSRSQPGGVYAVTATTTWEIEWWIEGTAIRGVEHRTRTSDETVRINELQVVTS